MTFTKTSQKFGQWSDVRANTVYGLGFSSEVELNKVRQFFVLSENVTCHLNVFAYANHILSYSLTHCAF